MLILTRKRQEEIHIGEDIVIKVTGLSPSHVKLGIEAPGDIRITRPDATCQNHETTIAIPPPPGATTT
jgi:carbon storage regulator